MQWFCWRFIIGIWWLFNKKKKRNRPLQKQLTIETKKFRFSSGAKTCFKKKQREHVTNSQTTLLHVNTHHRSNKHHQSKDMSSAKKFQRRNSRIGKSEDIHSGTTQSLKFWLAQCQIPMWIEIIVRGMAPTIYSLVYKCDIAILGVLSMLIYISDIFMNPVRTKTLSRFSFSSHWFSHAVCGILTRPRSTRYKRIQSKKVWKKIGLVYSSLAREYHRNGGTSDATARGCVHVHLHMVFRNVFTRKMGPYSNANQYH